MRSAGNLLGTTRSDQPGPSRVVSGGRTATISGGALSSLPVQNTHGPLRGRTGSMLKSVGRRARSVEMITQRPTTGSLRSSGTAALERRVFARGRAAEQRRQRVGGGLAVEEHGGDLGADRQRDAVAGPPPPPPAGRPPPPPRPGGPPPPPGGTVAPRPAP